MHIEKAIAFTLRAGVALCSIFVMIGVFLLFLNGGGGGISIEQIAASNSNVNSSTFSFGQIVSGLLHPDGISFILMGIIILIATPIVRVLLSTVGFFFERNWLYVAITLIVFIDLMVAIFIIPGLVGH